MASVTKNDQRNEPMADEQSSEDSVRTGSAGSGGGTSGGIVSGGTGGGGSAGGQTSGGGSRAGGGFFTIYKHGQGYWTRMGTAVAAGLIALLFADFVYNRLVALRARYEWKIGTGALLGISAAVFFLLVLWAWRLMNKPRNVDFLIATDSEMKKVNWTTRKELIGSTKVVCFFVILIAAILFSLDLIFGYLFYALRVLEVPPF
jgi:preprotein translocase SecE subunit